MVKLLVGLALFIAGVVVGAEVAALTSHCDDIGCCGEDGE